MNKNVYWLTIWSSLVGSTFTSIINSFSNPTLMFHPAGIIWVFVELVFLLVAFYFDCRYLSKVHDELEGK